MNIESSSFFCFLHFTSFMAFVRLYISTKESKDLYNLLISTEIKEVVEREDDLE